jgi:cell division protein FtsB
MASSKIRIPALFRSLYFWITLLALLWLVFLDPYSWLDQWRFSRRLAAMEAQLRFYEAEIARLQAEAEMLRSDPFTQEKYARAAFWVHRDEEILFVLLPGGRSGALSWEREVPKKGD